MLQILRVVISLGVLMLTGCTVSPSVLGGSVAGVSGLQTPENIGPFSKKSPGSTGSIVPPGEEAAVVDLPYSNNQMQASSSYQNEEAQEEPLSSEEERHRRELINRGDLQEGEPLPRR